MNLPMYVALKTELKMKPSELNWKLGNDPRQVVPRVEKLGCGFEL